MPVTATSLYAVPRYKLREMLANCVSVRTFLGVADAAAAMVEAKMPDEIILEPNVKDNRPFALVSQAGVFKISPMDNNTHWPSDRLMLVHVSMNVTDLKLTDEGIEGSPRDAVTTLENHVGEIMWELSGLSGRDSNLVLGDLTIVQKPTMSPSNSWANDCYCWASFNVEIDPNKGGT